MPKCNPTLKVPFDAPRPGSICASLMSSLASGPERIGLAADGALCPQATPHMNVSTERIAKALLIMGCTSSASTVPAPRALTVAKLRIQADAEPVSEHVGREHQHRDADAGEDLEPPPPFHQGLADRKSTRLNSSHLGISYA